MKIKKVLIIVMSFMLFVIGYNMYTSYQSIIKYEVERKALIEDINKHYNKYVKTNKEATIYEKKDKFEKVGTIASDIELSLEENSVLTYFNISNFDSKYYISYKDVDVIEELSVENNRYKNYIPFNENIVTKDITNFYLDDKVIYSFNNSYELPILIKDTDKYYVSFDNKLLYVKKDDVKEIIASDNTEQKNVSGISVLNYHFFYDDRTDDYCNQTICHSWSQFKSHLDYIKDNNYFTLTMHELELYIEGKINLPRSVVITIDDGWKADLAIKMLGEYKLNGTIFLITSWYIPSEFKTEYVETHSHGDNLHNPGVCPGGQGGGIKCINKADLLKDLVSSREKLNNSTVFCYPFYEYNDYAISVLKEAGYTMAFIGGSRKVKVNSNKYLLPRFPVSAYTTLDQFINMID